jgi:ribonuclease PH
MIRKDGRTLSDLRKIKIRPAIQKDPHGSVLIEWGNTHVICSVMIEDKLPNWMHGSSSGWITAEYSMLPGSSNKRIQRDKVRTTGRTHEIQRLIGRSLRACVNMQELGPKTIQIDCDVIQADGGTRVASITGSYLAFRLALHRAKEKGSLRNIPATSKVAAVSLGKVNGELLLDLDYSEDVNAEVDANVVMNEKLQLIEVQGTAEKGTFDRNEFSQMLDLAEVGFKNLFQIQNQYLKEWGLL